MININKHKESLISKAKLIVGLAALLCFTVAFYLTKQQSSALLSGPMLSLDKELVDFGAKGIGDNVSTEFTIKNVGNENLVLNNFAGNCGCLNVEELTQDTTKPLIGSRTLLSGQSLVIKAGIMPANFPPGERLGVISFKTNDPRQPSGQFTMRVLYDGAIASYPSAADFGIIDLDSEKSILLKIRNTGRKKPFDFHHLDCDEHFAASVSVPSEENLTPSERNLSTRINVKFSANQEGVHTGNLKVFGRDEAQPAVVIPLRVTVLPNISFEPTTLTLPRFYGNRKLYMDDVKVVAKLTSHDNLKVIDCPSWVDVTIGETRSNITAIKVAANIDNQKDWPLVGMIKFLPTSSNKVHSLPIKVYRD